MNGFVESRSVTLLVSVEAAASWCGSWYSSWRNNCYSYCSNNRCNAQQRADIYAIKIYLKIPIILSFYTRGKLKVQQRTIDLYCRCMFVNLAHDRKSKIAAILQFIVYAHLIFSHIFRNVLSNFTPIYKYNNNLMLVLNF